MSEATISPPDVGGQASTAGSSSAIPARSLAAAEDRTRGARLRLAAIACVLAPAGFLLANLSYAWATRSGGNDQTGADALKLYAANPTLLVVAINAAMIGSILIAPATLAAMSLARSRSAWFGLIGGSLMIGGYICYFGVNASSYTDLAMATRDATSADYAAILDASQSHPASLWIFLLFVAGNLIGTALLAVGLMRSPSVPTWIPIAILTWPVLHVTGLIAGAEWFEVTGAVLQWIGFIAIGTIVWRQAAGVGATATNRPAG